jgi:hypothetical protein
MKEEVEIVLGSSGHYFYETVVGKTIDRACQRTTGRKKFLLCCAPCLSSRRRFRRPVIDGANDLGHGYAVNRLQSCLSPNLDVRNQLPDGMSVRNRSSCSLLSADIGQKFFQRRSMPGLAFKCPAKLIGNACAFGGHKEIAAGEQMSTSRKEIQKRCCRSGRHVFARLDQAIGDLLRQGNHVVRLVLEQAAQDHQLRAQHVALGNRGNYFARR